MKKLLLILMPILFQVGVSPAAGQEIWNDTLSAPWTQGSGTEQDPYLIETREQFGAFRDSVNAGTDFKGIHFKLVNDLDFNPEEEASFEPIAYGPTGNSFAGHFDGNGKSLRIYWYFSPNDWEKYDSYGLWGRLDSCGSISNLTLAEGSVCAAYNKADIGALVGTNAGKITNCHSFAKLNGNYSNIGGLVGRNTKSGIIDSCTHAGYLMGVDMNGAIAGFNQGIIRNCANLYHSEGALSTGGIVGVNDSTGIISNCYNSGEVHGGSSPNETSMTGGIAAENYGLIENCFNSAYIHTEGVIWNNTAPTETGGIAALNQGSITNCYNTGDMEASGTKSVMAGIVHTNGQNGRISNCYSAARINTPGSALGSLAENENAAACSYLYYDNTLCPNGDSTGMPTRQLANTVLAGFDPGQWIFTKDIYPQLSSFKDKDAAQASVSTIYIGQNTLDSSNYDDFEFIHGDFSIQFLEGFSLSSTSSLVSFEGNTIHVIRPAEADSSIVVSVSKNDAAKSWNLKLIKEMDGRGSATDPYIIRTRADMEYFADNINRSGVDYEGRYLALDADLDLSERNWTPVGTYENRFAGHFDGRNHIIKNMTVNTDLHAGFFGVTDYTASVKNLTIDANSSVTGGKESAGGISGDGYGNYENCHNYAEVLGSSFVGGIVGFHFGGIVSHCTNAGYIEGTTCCIGGILGGNGESIIEYCMNMGEVACYSYSVGGIAGVAGGNVHHCYNFGKITGPENVGGITGRAMDSLTWQCYNAGLVEGPESSTGAITGVFESNNSAVPFRLENCFYDKQLCPVKDFSENIDTTYTIGLLTDVITNSNGLPELDTAWIVADGQYPILKAFADYPLAQMASAAAILPIRSETDYETVESVSDNIAFTHPYETQWSSSRPDIIAENGEVTLPQGEAVEVELTASMDGLSKSFTVTVPAATANKANEQAHEALLFVIQDVIHIEMIQEGFYHLYLFNMQGKLIDEQSVHGTQARFNVPAAGLYLVRIANQNSTECHKIIAGI